jgi:hypothetical protein
MGGLFLGSAFVVRVVLNVLLRLARDVCVWTELALTLFSHSAKDLQYVVALALSP